MIRKVVCLIRLKYDITVSCNRPILCDDCYSQFASRKVPKEVLDRVRIELRRIKKPLFTRIVTKIKKHPIASLFVTIVASVGLNMLSSLLYRLLGGK
jgi:hypothetical protein